MISPRVQLTASDRNALEEMLIKHHYEVRYLKE